MQGHKESFKQMKVFHDFLRLFVFDTQNLAFFVAYIACFHLMAVCNDPVTLFIKTPETVFQFYGL